MHPYYSAGSLFKHKHGYRQEGEGGCHYEGERCPGQTYCVEIHKALCNFACIKCHGCFPAAVCDIPLLEDDVCAVLQLRSGVLDLALYGTGCARGDYNLLESLCNCKNQSCKDYTAGVVGGGLYVFTLYCFGHKEFG